MGKYRHLRDDSESEYELKFVTSSENMGKMVTPKRHVSSLRSDRQLGIPKPLFYSEERQKAGGIATEDALKKCCAVIYYLMWTQKALPEYLKKIKSNFEKPLTERCTRKKVKVEQSSAAGNSKETAVVFADNNEDIAKLQQKLMERLSSDADGSDYKPSHPERFVTPIEAAALNRLSTLTKMSDGLMRTINGMVEWLEKNKLTITKTASEIVEALEFAVKGFDAICVLGEVFGLAPVEREKKNEYPSYLKKYVRPKVKGERTLEIPPTVAAKDYVPELTVIINHFRTIVFRVYSTTTSIHQTLLKAVPTELMNTTTKEMHKIVERLPPMFRTTYRMKLSEFAEELLSEFPPNKDALIFNDCVLEEIQANKEAPSKSSSRKAKHDPSQANSVRSDATQFSTRSDHSSVKTARN